MCDLSIIDVNLFQVVEREIQESEEQVLAYGKPMRRFVLKRCKNLNVGVVGVKDRHNEDVWQMVNSEENKGAEVRKTKV